ncbi:MAG: hypothetical protein ACRCV0_07095 [Brevinema sp.]
MKETDNKFNHDSLLYQELPSLSPRVSRSERISTQGLSDCPECSYQSLSKARQSVRFSYFLFLTLVILFFGVMKFTQIKNTEDNIESYHNGHMVLTINKKQTISVSLINQQHRYGLSLLFRNQQKQVWNINQISLLFKNELIEKTEINISLNKDAFVTTFIKLPKDINSLENINIVID